MGKLNIFEISFENQQAVYQAGQTVNGYVTVELNDAMKMRGIRLLFNGSAYVHWSETHSTGSGKNRRTYTKHYSSSESYFNHLIVLYGKGPNDKGDDLVLPAGRYTYPFTFMLPGGLPSSFEGAWGHVRYWVKGTIDRPWKFDHTTKRAFTVLSVLDLNQEPRAMISQGGENEKTLCCLCCASGPITARFSVPRTGYVPGESIPVQAEIENHSSRKMDKSSVILYQQIAFKATTKTRWSTDKVTSMVKGKIEAHSSDQWINAQIKIPPVPPSELVGCNIIDIKYTLVLEVDPSGPSLDLEVPLSIIIGTIPPQQAVQNYFGTAYNTAREYNPTPPGVTPTAPVMPTAPGLPPPSYASVTSGATNIKDDDDSNYTMGNLDYTPMYTYYDWSKPV